MEFKPYTIDDKAVQIYAELRPEDYALAEENLPGTLNTVADLRAKRASGMSEDELANLTINTDQEREVWPRLIAQLDADIAEAQEQGTSEETQEDSDEVPSEAEATLE